MRTRGTCPPAGGPGHARRGTADARLDVPGRLRPGRFCLAGPDLHLTGATNIRRIKGLAAVTEQSS